MKAKIVGINKCFNVSFCKEFWEIQIETEEQPNLKLGECEIIQK